MNSSTWVLKWRFFVFFHLWLFNVCQYIHILFSQLLQYKSVTCDSKAHKLSFANRLLNFYESWEQLYVVTMALLWYFLTCDTFLHRFSLGNSCVHIVTREKSGSHDTGSSVKPGMSSWHSSFFPPTAKTPKPPSLSTLHMCQHSLGHELIFYLSNFKKWSNGCMGSNTYWELFLV